MSVANKIGGAPGETRTPGLLVRSQPLYPTELRARTVIPLNEATQALFRSLGMSWTYSTQSIRVQQRLKHPGFCPADNSRFSRGALNFRVNRASVSQEGLAA
jgi:hypothetical protein